LLLAFMEKAPEMVACDAITVAAGRGRPAENSSSGGGEQIERILDRRRVAQHQRSLSM